MIGKTLGRFKVIDSLGSGGMGEAYRGKDEQRGRDVAIKVLPNDVASDPDRLARFEREAKLLAALSHPNILFIDDFGNEGGMAYVVTELLEGETLRDRMRQERLPWRQAVEIAAAIADGLAAAHGLDIFHRDLKPENIFLCGDGRVKILDFGLAGERLSLDDTETISGSPAGSGPGALTASVGYLAPEQVRGLAADGRADLFGLGCVLYEMLTGLQAFGRSSSADALAAVLTAPAPEPSASTPGIPPELDRLVARCLAKSPHERFQTAGDLAFALRSCTTSAPAARFSFWKRRAFWTAVFLLVLMSAAGWRIWRPGRSAAEPAPGTRRVKIVVLPFENLGDPGDAYFASGITDEITSRLANVRGLGVISRTSAAAYDRAGKTIGQIGDDLGVDFVLEGTVRWDRGPGRRNRVRITPQLIRTDDDTHVWTDRYDRTMADVFAIQAEVAEHAVGAMGVTLLPPERTALQEPATGDLEAYDLYLRGQELAARGENKADHEGALRLYQEAVERDPRFARAHSGIARMHTSMYFLYFDRDPDRLAQAKRAAGRALELRPDLAETHAALGWYLYHGRLDYPGALKEFAAALELQPRHSDASWGACAVMTRQGRWKEAAEGLRRALDLDPKNPQLLFHLAIVTLLDGRYAEADRSLERTIALSPQWAEPHAAKARLQVLWRGDPDGAQAALDRAGRIEGLADDEGELASTALQIALVRRDYAAALRRLEAEARPAIDNQSEYSPIPLLTGQIQRLAGLDGPARRSFEAARFELKQRIAQDPDDSRLHGALAIACAGLGLGGEAVREAQKGCELMPPSKDALRAIDRLADLALVHAMLGRTDEAIATLDRLLASSGWHSSAWLHRDPRWDPLRPDPRFQALLDKHPAQP